MESKSNSRRTTKSRGGRKGKRGKRRGGNGGRSNAPGQASATSLSTGFVIRSKPLFGYTARRNINYFTNSTVTSGASSAGGYVFAANGCFDPDITGTGGQPMGFDQMMIYFNHYTVLKSRIRVVFQNNSASLRTTVALLTSGSSTVTSVIENAVENGDISFQVLEYAGAFGGAATLKRAVDVGRFQGLRNTIDDPNMRGDSASNPAELVYYHLMCWNTSSATVVSSDFQVLLEYDVLFHEPRKASLS